MWKGARVIRPNNSECEVAAKAKAGVAIDDAAAQAQASGRQSAEHTKMTVSDPAGIQATFTKVEAK